MRARDWPIDYDTLRPYYDRVQSECGLSGDARREIWRPPGAPYPMPPLPVFQQGQIIARGFERRGLHVAPAPLAINSTVYRGRAACINDGWCDAGCPILALANPLAIHIPAARAAGARFMTGATVTRINLDRRGRLEGLDYVDEHGTRARVRADLVVLAAAPVQNARLMLASAQAGAPRGIGNRNGLVGHHFVCHNVVNVYGMFKEETQNHLGVTAGSLISQDGYRKDSHPGHAFGSYQWGIAPAVKPNDLLGIAVSRPELWGARLGQFMEQAARHLGAMSALCETLPNEANRIELGNSRDAHGVPSARIVRSSDADGPGLAEHVVAEGLQVMRAAGAEEAWRGILATSHPLGGTVMGDSPADSVTDSYGRVHELPGLVIAGGGLFPTAGGGSPTFTMLALAERAADMLLGR
jgi:choline dehydrogenase-like flavoprotein